MYKRTLRRLISVLAALAMGLSLLTGCGAKNAEQVQEQEDAQTIQVYLWSTTLYETYAPYVQEQLPDVNIEFIVGNNLRKLCCGLSGIKNKAPTASCLPEVQNL